MPSYFVDCDDLEHILTSRGIAGKWTGDDCCKEFRTDGCELSWLISCSYVVLHGERQDEFLPKVPELIPWARAAVAVSQKMEELRLLKNENAALKKRLCIV